MEAPGRETAGYILDRLVGEWRRYGRVFSVVRVELPAASVAEAIPRLEATLREPDVLAVWGDEELLVLLPETDQARRRQRRRAPARRRPRDPVLAGAVQWTGGSVEGLLSRARWVAARASSLRLRGALAHPVGQLGGQLGRGGRAPSSASSSRIASRTSRDRDAVRPGGRDDSIASPAPSSPSRAMRR